MLVNEFLRDFLIANAGLEVAKLKKLHEHFTSCFPHRSLSLATFIPCGILFPDRDE